MTEGRLWSFAEESSKHRKNESRLYGKSCAGEQKKWRDFSEKVLHVFRKRHGAFAVQMQIRMI